MIAISISNSHRILKKILLDGAYVHIALQEISDPEARQLVTKIVYGVLEKYYLLSYNISLYYNKKPASTILILLLIATYCLKFLNIPNHTIINETVNVTSQIGKPQLKPFVNGLLRKLDRENVKYPLSHTREYEQIIYNLPSWMIALIKRDYPNHYETILKAVPFEGQHVRLNYSVISNEEFELRFPEAIPTETGYLVKSNNNIKDMFIQGKITFQALASTLTVEALGDIDGKKILDVCAAPGGKAIYAAQKGGLVTALDIHDHRIKLIENYMSRMGCTLNVLKNDGLVFNKAFLDSFDIVVVDAPCSGLGVISKRQDMIRSKSLSDIPTLVNIQKRLLDISKKYVRVGGFLLYSTCTITNAENIEVVANFLETNLNFELSSDENVLDKEGKRQFFPNEKGLDGHFIARFIRKY